MAVFRISGVWKDFSTKTIVAYAFHTLTDESKNQYSLAVKKTKAEAILLLETAGNTATTWEWNYVRGDWNTGEKIEVVNGATGKYLRSKKDGQIIDNLAHLINYQWIKI